MGALDDILLIENAFRQAPEKARHAIFENLATGRQQRAIGCQCLAQWQQVIFIGSGSVQQEEWCGAGGALFKAVDK